MTTKSKIFENPDSEVFLYVSRGMDSRFVSNFGEIPPLENNWSN